LRAAAIAFSSLGALGLGIALLGVYGVTAYLVSERRREFSIMKALGASDHQVYLPVLRQGLRMVLPGAASGLVLALLLAAVFRRYLVGVRPYDLLTFTIVPVIFVTTALAACAIPVRRILRIQPSSALREL
jgi:ABC-type antimicrobial peptide transport system permease subunit